MNSNAPLTGNYEKVIKKVKLFSLAGELTIFIIRIMAQRVFSLYIGIVVIQIIVGCQINFRNYCKVQAKFYIIMNFVLIYLLTINYIEVLSDQQKAIQNIIKEKYIVDYVKLGYPLQFAFRFISTLIVWRVYQFSDMKSQQNGDYLPTEEVQPNTQRHDRIHVRQNTSDPDFQWDFHLIRSGAQNPRDLLNPDSVGLRDISRNPTRILNPTRVVNSVNWLINRQPLNQNRERRLIPEQQNNQISGSIYLGPNRNLRNINGVYQFSTQRVPPFTNHPQVYYTYPNRGVAYASPQANRLIPFTSLNQQQNRH